MEVVGLVLLCSVLPVILFTMLWLTTRDCRGSRKPIKRLYAGSTAEEINWLNPSEDRP